MSKEQSFTPWDDVAHWRYAMAMQIKNVGLSRAFAEMDGDDEARLAPLLLALLVPSETAAPVVQSAVEALRHGQALAVVPLVGNVLDHWDRLPNDLKDQIRETSDGLHQAIDAVNGAMEHHEPVVQSAIGLCTEQEPKYTVLEGRIVNRASGETIPDDEPVFIFRARDKQASAVLRFYMTRVAGNAEHWGAVEQRLKDFQRFAEEHPDRMKEPDTVRATDSRSAKP